MTDRTISTAPCSAATKDDFIYECTATALASPDWPGLAREGPGEGHAAKRDAMLNAMHAALARVRLGLVFTQDTTRVCGPYVLNPNFTQPGRGLGELN